VITLASVLSSLNCSGVGRILVSLVTESRPFAISPPERVAGTICSFSSDTTTSCAAIGTAKLAAARNNAHCLTIRIIVSSWRSPGGDLSGSPGF